MTDSAAIETRIDALAGAPDPAAAVAELLRLGEEVLCRWVAAAAETPTAGRREGFRLLALHRQGARGRPSFIACRETCRELAYHYNLITFEPEHPETAHRLRMAAMVAKHLHLFVTGKMRDEGLGEFCCSSRPLRQAADR